MQCELTVLVSMAQIASALVLGGAGLYFTTRQISISRDKLRLDHFDKRFAVYEAARRFLERASQQGQVSPQDENEFFAATRGATFLFRDQTVAIYLDKLRSRMIDLTMGREAMRQSRSHPDEQTSIKYLEDQKWVRAQYTEIEEIFRKHLQLNG